MSDRMRGFTEVVPNLAPANTFVMTFTGAGFPRPVGARVVATSPAPRLWSVLQFDGTGTGQASYDLGSYSGAM